MSRARRILEFLLEAECTPVELAAELSIGLSLVKSHLFALKRAGKVVQTGRSTKGQGGRVNFWRITSRGRTLLAMSLAGRPTNEQSADLRRLRA